jgi:ATP synthase F1 complex assembly factor 1
MLGYRRNLFDAKNALMQLCAVRTASVTNVRFIQSKTFIDKHIKDKYRGKLEARAKQKGLESADKLMEEMKETIEETKKQLNMIDPLKELEDYEQAMNLKDSLSGKKKKLDKNGKAREGISPETPTVPYKTLESYLVLDKIKELEGQQIEFLWRAKFQNDSQSLTAIAQAPTFEAMYKNARKYPTFVLPLPKENAQVEGEGEGTPMEIHFVQWSFVGPYTTHCMITTLMEYKLHKEYARPHTSISFHQELQKEKGVVLMHGHVDPDSAITTSEAQMLLLNVQRFYGAFQTGSEVEKKRLQLLEAFNGGSNIFSMEECIVLAQSMEN